MSESNYLLRLYYRVTKWPAGHWIFSKLFAA